VTWDVVDSLDPSGPFDRHVETDLEAGTLLFGDGRRGMIPPLVPGAGNIVAVRYRHGGGRAGEVGAGTITNLETQHVGVAGVVNIVSAQGGDDAETVVEAKIRARKELSTRSRAVTAGDFEWIALQTPDVRVARVTIVPLRRPLSGPAGTAPSSVLCGVLPAGPSGLDDNVVAHGAVSVVVVPDLEGPEPIPAPSFLRAVCNHLNDHRLVTTEVYVVPPQYARLCKFRVRVRAKPGYTRTQLQDLVEAKLGTYLHVLTGGEDGTGFPFGGQIHVADLISQVFRTEGIERVEDLGCDFSRTKSNANPRQGSLVLCPGAEGESDSLTLAPEETVSIDLTTFTLTTVD
jgi:predicted phage baseplate assembly protein